MSATSRTVRALVMAGVTALGLAGTASAQTFTDTWSFIDQNGNTVAGTLSGIQNGTNLSAYGLTAVVTQTLYSELLGPYTIDYAGQAAEPDNECSASGGVITSASFVLSTNFPSDVSFGTNPGVTLSPVIADDQAAHSQFNLRGQDTFALAPTTVPEPASLALLGLPLGLLGLVGMRRRQGAAAA